MSYRELREEFEDGITSGVWEVAPKNERDMEHAWREFVTDMWSSGEITCLQYRFCPPITATVPEDDIDYILGGTGLRLFLEVQWTESRPDKLEPKRFQGNHYCCVLKNAEGKSMSFYYSKGSALKGPPKLREVVECLVFDSRSIEESDSFEEWAQAFGYDEDSRAAERIYNACLEQHRKLKGVIDYETIVDLQTLFDEL